MIDSPRELDAHLICRMKGRVVAGDVLHDGRDVDAPQPLHLVDVCERLLCVIPAQK